jgi:hypothetical protein
MENNVTPERKAINESIKQQVFKIEKENYHKKVLSSNDMVTKIRKIVEEAVK